MEDTVAWIPAPGFLCVRRSSKRLMVVLEAEWEALGRASGFGSLAQKESWELGRKKRQDKIGLDSFTLSGWTPDIDGGKRPEMFSPIFTSCCWLPGRLLEGLWLPEAPQSGEKSISPGSCRGSLRAPFPGIALTGPVGTKSQPGLRHVPTMVKEN